MRICRSVFVAGVCALVGAWGASAAEAAPKRTLYTNTSAVEDLLVLGDRLWVATRGGLELYDLRTRQRLTLLTTESGLPANRIDRLGVDGEGGRQGAELWAHVGGAVCSIELRGGPRPKIGCMSAPEAPKQLAVPVAAPRFQGARITREATWRGHRIVGTATAGVWLDDEDLTPLQAICSNHIVAMTRFAGRTWFGSFDEGLCALDEAGWQRVPGAFRMINDLLAVEGALFVAASEGLFVTRDGEHFRRVTALKEPVADLAYDERRREVLAVTNTTLWRLASSGGRARALFRPGGSRSLQAVTVAGDGVVWLASEDRGALKLVGDRVEIYDALAGLPSSWAIDVGVSKEGVAYVGTLRHGAVALALDGSPPGPSEVRALHGTETGRWTLSVTPALEGGVWVGAQDGLTRIAGSTRQPLSGVPHPCVHAVFEPDAHQLWIGTEGGTLLVANRP